MASITLLLGHNIIAVDPNFSLHNKSSKTIWIEINNGRGLWESAKALVMTEADGILPDRFYDKTIDISKKTELAIYDNNKKVLAKVTFPLNKTIYINWDGATVYPQRGPLKGLTGKTDKKYSLKNNVKKGEITILSK
jgi:hypothetical protein